MKKLLLTSVLALSLALPLSAFAGNNIFGVSTPIERNQVSSNVVGGYVAQDLGDTFKVQRLEEKSGTTTVSDEGGRYLVFGVEVVYPNRI